MVVFPDLRIILLNNPFFGRLIYFIDFNSICVRYSCEGKCLRSFHANVGSGAEDFCETLGYTDAQVKVLTSLLSLCVYSLYLLVLL